MAASSIEPSKIRLTREPLARPRGTTNVVDSGCSPGSLRPRGTAIFAGAAPFLLLFESSQPDPQYEPKCTKDERTARDPSSPRSSRVAGSVSTMVRPWRDVDDLMIGWGG